MFTSVPGLRSILPGYLCLFVVFVAGAVHGQANDIPLTGEFVRFVQGQEEFEGELQTAIVSYRNSQGVELDLVAAVHMAEGQYYQRLNDYFSTRDAVLYELVADENVRPGGQGPTGGTGVIGFIQSSLTRMLGLSYQLDSINYNRANFIHADLEPAELDAIMEARGETLFSSILSLVVTEMANSEAATGNGQSGIVGFSSEDIVRAWGASNRQGAFKHLLGQGLAFSAGSFSAADSNPGGGITILDGRNDVALEVLQDSLQIPDLKKITIFYGAAHMTGLERGILKLGFNKVAQSWLTAWHTP